MARTVDPARHEARRLQIIDAALTVFAQRGYHDATTAAICQEAGIGSGTFFHYFGTKIEVLLAILRLGADETKDQATAIDVDRDPLQVLLELVAGSADEARDPRAAGFVRAVTAIMHLPEVGEALEASASLQRELYIPWIERAQSSGQIRTDLSPSRIVSWLSIWTDGFLERAAIDNGFDPDVERQVLLDTVRAFLTSASPSGESG